MTKIDENTKLSEVLKDLNAETADTLTCWGDLYLRLRKAAELFTSNPSPGSAAGAVATLISFVLALEELPEEGDVVVIARRMNEILLTAPERTGVKFLVLSSTSADTKEAIDALAERVRQEALAAYDEGATIQEAMNEVPTTKYLH